MKICYKMKIQTFLLLATVISSSWGKAVPPSEQENALVKENENSGRQINSILDIPQQVASFLGNALFPTTPTTTRATTPLTTVKPSRRSLTTVAATAPPTPRIRYVYVTPPGPRVVIVKPRPFAPQVVAQPATPQATEATVATEPTTEAAEGSDEDEDEEEEGNK